MDPNKALDGRFHFCGSPSLGPLSCVAAYLRAGGVPRWEQLARGHHLPTHRCRTAIRAVLPALGLGPGAEVLAPAFNCGSEIAAILAGGASVRMFDVTPDARIDAATIASRLTRKTKAVYVIHYFGWPLDLAPVRALCDSEGLLLLEDCALSLFCRDHGGWLGRHGDVSFYSVMKTFGVPDGGITVSRTPLDLRFPRSPTIELAKECARLAKRAVVRSLSRSPIGAPGALARGRRYSPIAKSAGGREPMPRAYHYDDAEMTGARMSRVTRGIIGAANPDRIIAARRANYQRLVRGIAGVSGLRPLFTDLPEGVCPLVMPLVTADRDRWMSGLSALGAHPTAWWSGYHPDLDFSEFPNACALKDSLIALPLHQQLNETDMDFLTGCVHSVAADLR
jgi:perosamine synthetase